MTRPSASVWCCVVGVGLSLGGCASLRALATTDNVATAELRDAEGRQVGTATLTEVGDGVRVVLEMRGMAPGVKAVHIHEVGRCEPPTFASAGAHLNPDGRQHGLLNSAGPHAGDLPNITIAPGGSGRLETLNNRVTLRGHAALLDADGSALVVHAMPDDFITDPSGGSGGRVACGVLGKAASGPEPAPPPPPVRPGY